MDTISLARGALFADVNEKRPAKTAGTRAGDVVVRFDAKENDYRDLASAIIEVSTGKHVDVVIIPNAKEQMPKVTIGRRTDLVALADIQSANHSPAPGAARLVCFEANYGGRSALGNCDRERRLSHRSRPGRARWSAESVNCTVHLLCSPVFIKKMANEIGQAVARMIATADPIPKTLRHVCPQRYRPGEAKTARAIGVYDCHHEVPPRRRRESANDHAMLGKPKIIMSSAYEEVVIMPDVVGSSQDMRILDG